MTELLRGKTPRHLLEETLTELETRANLTPQRYAALVRLSALLLRVEAQRIQFEETGGRSFASDALANAALHRMQAQELAAVLSERYRRPERCYRRVSSLYIGSNWSLLVRQQWEETFAHRRLVDKRFTADELPVYMVTWSQYSANLWNTTVQRAQT